MNNQTKLWNREFIIILFVQFCLQMGQQMLNTLVPLLADSLGASASAIGLISSIFSIASTLVLIFVTPAFDCSSRKKILLISIFFTVLAFTGYGFTKTIPMLFVFRFIQGASQGCIMALGLVMVSDTLPRDKLGKGIGIFTLCQAVAQAVGPGIGLDMKDSLGYSMSFFIGTGTMVLGLAAGFFIKEGENTSGTYSLSIDRIIAKEAIPASVLVLILQGAYCSISSFIAIYGALRGVDEIGLYFTVYAIGLIATRPVSGMLIDKIGYEVVVVVGIIFFALSFLVIGMASSLWMFLLAAVFAALGYGVCQPTLNYICMRCVPTERRGAASCTSNIAMSIGFLVAVTGAGYIVDAIKGSTGNETLGYSRMYTLMIVPIAAALVYFFATNKKIRKAIEAVEL